MAVSAVSTLLKNNGTDTELIVAIIATTASLINSPLFFHINSFRIFCCAAEVANIGAPLR